MSFLFHVQELFDLRERGVVVISDRPLADCDFELKIADTIEFRTPEGLSFQTSIAGIETCNPFDPQREFAFILPRQMRKGEVPVGAEVWKIGDQLPPA